MQNQSAVKNWALGNELSILEDIHHEDVNIAIYKREVNQLDPDISTLLDRDFEFRASGDIADILDQLSKDLGTDAEDLVKDAAELLANFKHFSGAASFRFLLATVKTDMCRKFHTDINDLRLLCTYSGPGTLWLTEENTNRRALGAYGGTESIVRDEKQIRQAETGDVLVLKGAVYPKDKTKAVVHRSPTIQDKGLKRLVLRIDTNEFLNF